MASYKNPIKLILLLVGIFIFIIFLKNIDYNVFKASINTLGLKNLLIVISFTLFIAVVRAIQWQFITKKISNTPINFWFSYICVLSGIASSTITPGRFDVVKPFMLKTRYNIDLSKSFPAVTIEKIFDILSSLVIIIIGIYFIPTQSIVSYKLIFILFLILIGSLMLSVLFPYFFIRLINKIIKLLPLSEKIAKKTVLFIESLLLSVTILKKKQFLLIITVMSLLSNIIEIARFYFIFQLFNIDISIFLAGLAFAASTIIGAVSSVPGGIGVTEISAAGIVIAILKSANVEVVKSAVLIDRALSYYLVVLLGSLSLIFWSGSKKSS